MHGNTKHIGCNSELCDSKHYIRGYCKKHYNSILNKGRGNPVSVERRAWLSMINRCTNPDNPKYSYYGGRGIKVCDEWLSSFEKFYDDMGDRTGTGYSIDRIDNAGNYEPTNCKWSTAKEQANNRRTRKDSNCCIKR